MAWSLRCQFFDMGKFEGPGSGTSNNEGSTFFYALQLTHVCLLSSFSNSCQKGPKADNLKTVDKKLSRLFFLTKQLMVPIIHSFRFTERT